MVGFNVDFRPFHRGQLKLRTWDNRLFGEEDRQGAGRLEAGQKVHTYRDQVLRGSRWDWPEQPVYGRYPSMLGKFLVCRTSRYTKQNPTHSDPSRNQARWEVSWVKMEGLGGGLRLSPGQRVMGVEAPEECGYWLGLAQPLPAQYWASNLSASATKLKARHSTVQWLGWIFCFLMSWVVFSVSS